MGCRGGLGPGGAGCSLRGCLGMGRADAKRGPGLREGVRGTHAAPVLTLRAPNSPRPRRRTHPVASGPGLEGRSGLSRSGTPGDRCALPEVPEVCGGSRGCHLPDPGTPGPKRDPEQSPREMRGAMGEQRVPINSKLAAVHQQEVRSIHVPRGTGAPIGCSRGASALTLSQPDPLSAAGGRGGRARSGPHFAPPARAPAPQILRDRGSHLGGTRATRGACGATFPGPGVRVPACVRVLSGVPAAVPAGVAVPGGSPSMAQPPGARGTGRRESAVGRARGRATGRATGRAWGRPRPGGSRGGSEGITWEAPSDRDRACPHPRAAGMAVRGPVGG